MNHRALRVYMVVTSALAFALALGAGWGLERAQARPLAGVVTVTNTNDSGPSSLRAALAAANPGDTIQFNLPANSVIVLTSGELLVSQMLSIDGSTAVNLMVNGNNASRVFSVTAPLTVYSLTIENGSAGGPGGGMSTNSPVTLSQVTFLSNTTFFVSVNALPWGGGLYAASSAVLSDVTFISNTPFFDGGGAYIVGNATVSGGTFERNLASHGGGGGLNVNGTVMLTGTQFLSNTAVNCCGGGVLAGSTAILSDVTFIANTNSANLGGGARFFGDATVLGGRFERNTADGGGGMEADHGLLLVGTLFLSNTAAGGGGLLAENSFSDPPAVLSDVIFIANTATNFGGGANIFLGTLAGGVFERNGVTGGVGGGLYTDLAVLTGTRFVSNTALLEGGGLYGVYTTTINGAGFSGNRCLSGGCTGGGLYVRGGPSAGMLLLSQTTTTSDDVGVFKPFANSGTFVQSAGTTTFGNTSGAESITGSGTTTFHHVQVSNTAGVSLWVPINVTGNFTDTGVFAPAGGSVSFNGTEAQQIVGTSPTTFGDLELANIGAGVSLGQDITVTNRLTLTTDLTTTTGYTLSLGASTTTSGPGDVWGRTVRAHPFNLGTPYAFGNPFVSLDFTGGTPPSAVTVDLTRTLPFSFTNAVGRVYQIEPAGGSGYTARLRLHYRDSELNGNQEGVLQLWRYPPGGPWTAYAATAFDATDNWVEHNNVTALSAWTISQYFPISQRLYVPALMYTPLNFP